MLQFLLDFEQSIRKQCEIDRPRLGCLECSQILVRNVDGPLRTLKLTAHPISPPPRQFYGRPNRTALGEMVNPDYGIIRIETDSGHSGIGDICTVFSPGGKSLCADANRYLARVLLNEDPFRISYLVARWMKPCLEPNR